MDKMMLPILRRRFFWIVGAVLFLCAGYTAGYLLAPPPPAAVSRTLPEAPVEAPQPLTPADTIEDA